MRAKTQVICMPDEFDWSIPLIPMLQAAGIEPDQRIRDAIDLAHHPFNKTLGTGTLFAALQILETRGFEFFPDIGKEYIVVNATTDLREVTAMERLCQLLEENAEFLRKVGSFGAGTYLQMVIRHAIANPTDKERPIALQKIAMHYAGSPDANLDQIPRLQRLLGRLRIELDGTNDYQYTLTNDEGRFQFRIIGHLTDALMRNEHGGLNQHRALITHAGGIGFFTSECIEELEDLINTASTPEGAFQDFFERHPHFLRRNDHREVHPHVYLTREEGPLIPDFILTNPDTQQATLLELKRAGLKTRLVRNPRNRIRFSDAIMEARAQLLEYRDWFDIEQNRRSMINIFGMEVFKPKIMVIIGRSSEFGTGIRRAKLADRVPDLDVLTYDDILQFARQRKLIIQ